MTVNRTWVDPSEAGTMDLDTGQALTDTVYDAICSDLLNLGSTDGGKSRVTAQFDKTNNASLSNITGLSLSVAASGVYAFRSVLQFSVTATSGGVKVAISGTATATAIVYGAELWGPGAGGGVSHIGQATAMATGLGSATSAANGTIIIEGLITVNGAGTLTVQWAQNSAQSGTSSVLVGSSFQAWVHA